VNFKEIKVRSWFAIHLKEEANQQAAQPPEAKVAKRYQDSWTSKTVLTQTPWIGKASTGMTLPVSLANKKFSIFIN
jgi:hypothetical protein